MNECFFLWKKINIYESLQYVLWNAFAISFSAFISLEEFSENKTGEELLLRCNDLNRNTHFGCSLPFRHSKHTHFESVKNLYYPLGSKKPPTLFELKVWKVCLNYSKPWNQKSYFYQCFYVFVQRKYISLPQILPILWGSQF